MLCLCAVFNIHTWRDTFPSIGLMPQFILGIPQNPLAAEQICPIPFQGLFVFIGGKQTHQAVSQLFINIINVEAINLHYGRLW